MKRTAQSFFVTCFCLFLLGVGVLTALPFLPFGRSFGLAALPAGYFGWLALVTAGYMAAAALVHRRLNCQTGSIAAPR